jgi:hypothetical protein
MKVILEFSEDDAYEAKMALRASELAAAIDEARNYIRGILKHGDPSDEVEKHLEHIRGLLPYLE